MNNQVEVVTVDQPKLHVTDFAHFRSSVVFEEQVLFVVTDKILPHKNLSNIFLLETPFCPSQYVSHLP